MDEFEKYQGACRTCGAMLQIFVGPDTCCPECGMPIKEEELLEEEEEEEREEE